ncbi:hypothetical protein S7335_3365 [Synechococcus sp. PCC 7335]|nr:hypothetical protein S7335_3365 [Synechococcus sp. PCC 7335]
MYCNQETTDKSECRDYQKGLCDWHWYLPRMLRLEGLS